MSNFTKGPWHVAKGEHYACVKSSEGVICDARVVNSLLPSVADLNLIAAAPDLYEALVALVALGFASELHDSSASHKKACAAVNAALYKARGQS